MATGTDLMELLWSARNDAEAVDILLGMFPPEIESEIRLGGGWVADDDLVVVEMNKTVERRDVVEWLVVRLDAPLRDDKRSYPVPGQSGSILAPVGWSAVGGASPVWVRSLFESVVLPVFDVRRFWLRDLR